MSIAIALLLPSITLGTIPSGVWVASEPTAKDLLLQETQTPVLDSDANASGQALQLRSDQQIFNQSTEVFQATGNVELRFGRTRLRADQMQVDLRARQVIAEGNIEVELGNQRVRGTRLTYNFDQETGILENASGQVDTSNLPRDINTSGLSNDPLNPNPPSPQPPRFVRFQAQQIRFDANTWTGENVRITNDPLNPPELEIRSPQVTSVLQPSGSQLITAEPGQLVFDQALFLPLPIRLRIDELDRQPPITLLYDDFDREELRRGLIIQPNFELSQHRSVSFVVSPQLYPQRLFDSNEGLLDGIGLQTRLQVTYPTQQVTHVLVELRGLLFEEFADRLRVKVEQVIPTGDGGSVNYTYAYRERFFSGLLGFQIVENRVGVDYNSPVIKIGNTGVDFSYKLSLDQIEALGQSTIDLDPEIAKQSTEQLQLTRAQLGTALSRSFPVWQPDTQSTTSLRFTSTPIEKGLWINTGISSSQTYYSNGEAQSYVSGSVGIDAVFGDFSANTFDYTNLSATYSNGFLAGASPFLFDRITTREQLVLGILQQVYGPLRVGAETTIDLQLGENVDTTYTLGYDRRTYGVNVKFNPIRQTGSFELRVDSFNWSNSGETITEVRGGIER
jgi:lipopolysaccharide export system protein LptA